MPIHMRLILTALIVAGVGFAIYYLGENTRVQNPAPEENPPAETTLGSEPEVPEQPTKPTSGRGSLYALLAEALPLECRVSFSPEEGQTITGTAHLAGGKIHGAYDINVESMSYTMYTIFDGEYAYTWGDTSFGTFANKMRVDPTTLSGEATGQSGSPGVTQEVDYDCSPWLEDASLFVPPAEIEFTDATAQLEAARAFASSTTNTQSMRSDPCLACDQLPSDEMRTQCRASLSCE